MIKIELINKHIKVRLKETKIYLIIIGLLSLIWFLIRVIPKPSRAAYPCQQALFPVASAFIIWITGVFASSILYRKAQMNWIKKRYISFSIMAFLGLSIFISVSVMNQPILSNANINFPAKEVFQPSDPANTPMGEGKGIYPGRVVWSYNPEATNWDGKTGYWWSDININSIVVEKMMSETVQKLTGCESNTVAWDSLFRYFNRQHLKGNVGYISGQKIAIKINMNTSNGHGAYSNNTQNSTPQVVLALLRQLVNEAGVKASDITLYDVSRQISGSVYAACKSVYPDVNFVDKSGNDGRIKCVTDYSCQIKWSQKLTLESGGGNPTYLPTCLSQADYLINLANLKGHDLAGISLCSKNLFGSFISKSSENSDSNPISAGVHPYVTVHQFDYWDFPMRETATYNALVDLMGHKDLGIKTLLFLVDGLYACPTQMNQITTGERWLSSPFNNDWTSSLFASQDNVAIESVCLDFLRTEQAINPKMTQVYGNVDNYLHEAALANNAPSGVFYDSDGNGFKMKSLGVHEHWSDAAKKSYSRNLNKTEGIELVSIPAGLVYNESTGFSDFYDSEIQFKNYPNPFRGRTQISYFLENKAHVNLSVIDKNGRLVCELINKNEFQGLHNIDWNAENQSSGIYICRIVVIDSKGENSKSIKLQVIN
jgi:hypothetical protein